MRTRRGGDALSRLVCTEEVYGGTRPDLLRLIRAAGPDAASAGSSTPNHHVRGRARSRYPSFGAADLTTLAPMKRRTFLSPSCSTNLLLEQSDVAELPEQADVVLRQLLEMQMEDTDTQAFPHSGVYAIRRSDALLYRLKIMSVLLRVGTRPPRGGRRHLSHLGSATERQQQRSLRLRGRTSTMASTCLIRTSAQPGALTPAVWGFAALRGRGPVIFSWGAQLAGIISPHPAVAHASNAGSRLSHTLPGTRSPTVPTALRWWTNALNDLFWRHNRLGRFHGWQWRQPHGRHLESVATVEQLFRRVLSIQASHNDLNARRVLLFTVLDTLEALTGKSIGFCATRPLRRRHWLT